MKIAVRHARNRTPKIRATPRGTWVSGFILGATVVATLAVSTACGAESETVEQLFQDAPVGATDNTAATILKMPDGYSNLASKCDGPNRVYVAFHWTGVSVPGTAPSQAVAVAPNDPRCTGTN